MRRLFDAYTLAAVLLIVSPSADSAERRDDIAWQCDATIAGVQLEIVANEMDGNIKLDQLFTLYFEKPPIEGFKFRMYTVGRSPKDWRAELNGTECKTFHVNPRHLIPRPPPPAPR